MWCRVLPFVIALTCTFQKEITADTDDVLCVVILSGLQKEDLDVNLLKKLQRHNVNIDDVYNRKAIDKCISRSSSDRLKENETAIEIVPTKSKQSEQTISQVNYNINETIEIEDISKENKNQTDLNTLEIENKANIESRTILSYENFIKLWVTLNKTSQHGNEVNTKETEKGMTVKLPLSFEKETINDFLGTDLDNNHKMFESYISGIKVATTTITPNIVNYQRQNQADIVSQQIMKILNKNINLDKNFVHRIPEETQSELKNTRKMPKLGYNISKNTFQIPSYEKFINVWEKSNKTNHQDNAATITKETEKNITVQLPFIVNMESNIDSEAKYLDFITKMLGTYLSQQLVTTIKPKTTVKQNDVVSQKINTFFKKFNINRNMNSVSRASEETKRNRNAETNNLHGDKLLAPNSKLISNKQLTQKHYLVIPGPLDHHFQNTKQPKYNLRISKTRSNLSERLPTNLNRDTSIDPQSKYTEMLKAYIAAQFVQASTPQPPTTPTHISIILQEIKELLENNNKNSHKFGELNTYNTHNKNNQNLITHKSVSIPNNNELHKQDQSIISNLSNTNSKDEHLNNLKNDQANNEKQVHINNADCHSKELDNIFHMFETYIAKKDTEKKISVPIPTSKPIDIIAQKVKEFLDNKDTYRRVMVTQVPAQNVGKVYDSEDLFVTREIDYTKEPQKQANQFKMPVTSEIPRNNGQQTGKYSHTVQSKSVTESNETIKIVTKPLSEDVIREITEQVKASVLKDLQKQKGRDVTASRSFTKVTTIKITATTEIFDQNVNNATNNLDNSKKLFQRYKKESGHETTTELPPTRNTTLNIDQNKIKTATNALENFIELFEQFKHITDGKTFPDDLKHTLTQKGKTKNEFHGPINVVYPSLLPPNYAYNNTHQISPMFLNSYGLQINNPMVQKRKITNEVNRFQFSVDPQDPMKNKMEHAIRAAVIQTDDALVPLLGIPVSRSVSPINQNIIVTTKHPIIQFREDQEKRSQMKNPKYQDYTVHGLGKYDTDSERQSEIDKGRQSEADMERHYNTDMTRRRSDMERAYGRDYRNMRGRYPIYDHESRKDEYRLLPRNKQENLATDNFYREYLNNIRPKNGILWDLAQFPQDNKRERFHETLEKPDEWQYRHRDREIPNRGRETPSREKRLQVASRKQLSMNNLKKKNRYDDTHYINFLKSQQKVNDMLEKMLKPSDRLRSVEAI